MVTERYSILSKVKDLSVKRALGRALFHDGRISFKELQAIVRSSWDYGGISYQEFLDLRSILNHSRTMDRSSRALLTHYLRAVNNHYGYLQRLKARRSFSLPYTQDHIPESTANNRRPGTSMSASSLTIHSTANPKSSASGERRWLTHAENSRTASYHIVVDETEAIECIPLDEVAYHAGDHDGNTTSIGLEICESGDREKTLDNAAALAAKILRDRGWDTASLKRHFDWSGKTCPRILISAQHRAHKSHTWEKFRRDVAGRL